MGGLKINIDYSKVDRGEYKRYRERYDKAEESIDEGRISNAIALYRENLQWSLRVLSQDHRATVEDQEALAFNLNEFASSKSYPGNAAEKKALLQDARNLNQNALDARERLEGKDPPSEDLLNTQRNLANDHVALGDVLRAAKIYEENYDARKTHPELGTDDEETLRTGFDLAACWHRLGSYSKARELNMKILQSRERASASEPDIIESKEALASNLYRLGRFKTARDYHVQNVETLKNSHRDLGGTLEKKRKIQNLVKQCDDKIEAKAAERRRAEEKKELERQELKKKELEKGELERKEFERKEFERKELERQEKEREAAEAAAELKKKERHEAAKKKAEEKAKQKEKEAQDDSPAVVPEIKISNPPVFSNHTNGGGHNSSNHHGRSKSQDAGLFKTNSDPSKSAPDLRPNPSRGQKSNMDGKSQNKPNTTLNADSTSAIDNRGRSNHQNNGSKITRSSSTAAAMPQRHHRQLFGVKQGKDDDVTAHAVDEWFADLEDQTQKLLQPLRRDNAKRIKIAVLDTGIDLTHPDFAEDQKKERHNRRIKNPEDFLDAENKGRDKCGHGTHCVWLLRKIAPEADIYVMRVADNFDTGVDGGVVSKAIDRAANGPKKAEESDGKRNWDVDIISMSFGFYGLDNKVKEALDRALAPEKPRLVFAAASNNGSRRRNATFPAWYPGVIGVNSSDADKTPSSFNPPLSSGMPFTILGENVRSAWIKHKVKDVEVRYRTMSGTSVATPIAAAVSALMLEFVLQDNPKSKLKTKIGGLKTDYGMSQILKSMSSDEAGYKWIAPWYVLTANRDREAAKYELEKAVEDFL